MENLVREDLLIMIIEYEERFKMQEETLIDLTSQCYHKDMIIKKSEVFLKDKEVSIERLNKSYNNIRDERNDLVERFEIIHAVNEELAEENYPLNKNVGILEGKLHMEKRYLIEEATQHLSPLSKSDKDSESSSELEDSKENM